MTLDQFYRAAGGTAAEAAPRLEIGRASVGKECS